MVRIHKPRIVLLAVVATSSWMVETLPWMVETLPWMVETLPWMVCWCLGDMICKVLSLNKAEMMH